MAELLGKITIKKCAGDPRALIARHMPTGTDGLPKDGAKLPLLRVVGRVSSATTEMTDMGPYIKFRGQFRAQSANPDEDGVLAEYMSSQCILPEIAALPIFEAMYALGKEEEVSESEKAGTDSRGRPKRSRVVNRVRIAEQLDFAYDIFATVDRSSATGYMFAVQPLIQPKEDDPVSRLLQDLPKLPHLGVEKTDKGKTAAKA